MATEYKDVLRLEGVEGTIEATTLRNKQVGFSTDGQHRMVRKNATGTPDYWTADGYNVTYGNVTISEYLYHDGDLTTFLQFTTGAFELVAGGTTYIETGYTGLKLDEQVIIGQYVMPYTGGTYNQVLGVDLSGNPSWVDQGTTGMRLNDAGALQIRMINDTGGILTNGWLLQAKTDSYANGVDYAIEDCQNILGVADDGAVTNGSYFWMTVAGAVDVRFFTGMQAVAGQLFGAANAYAAANEGIAKSWPGKMTASLGYCQTDSSGVANIARCHFNGASNGIDGSIALTVTGFSDLSEVTVQYSIVGRMACIYLPGFQGTSDQAYIKFTSFPAWLSGSNNSYTTPVSAANTWINGGSATLDGNVCGQFDTLSGTLELILFDGTDIGWDATGTKGLYYPMPFYYFIQ
jgi:hypothetical protein